jgi:hypothetical protein
LILTFVLGWGLWLWMDKQGPAYSHAARLEGGDDLLRDFQAGFDLVKAGEPGAAFAFLWYHHYLLLTILLALLLTVLVPPFRRSLSFARRRKAALPLARKDSGQGDHEKD